MRQTVGSVAAFLSTQSAFCYDFIEAMTATEPQGLLKDDANIERLCGVAWPACPGLAFTVVAAQARHRARRQTCVT
jgi:hypothetical protein